jgi:hypothetical protein
MKYNSQVLITPYFNLFYSIPFVQFWKVCYKDQLCIFKFVFRVIFVFSNVVI